MIYNILKILYNMKYIKKLIVGNNFNLLSLNNYDVTVDALDILIEIPKIKLLNNYYIDLIEISKNQKIKIKLKLIC